MVKQIIATSLLFSTVAFAAPKAVDCMNSAQAVACAAQVGASMKKDAFMSAVMKAEAKRLPASWKCEDATDWHVDFVDALPVAKVTLVCSGAEQHVNIDFAGTVEANASGVWRARLVSFAERPGE